jgi:hypothetical protein
MSDYRPSLLAADSASGCETGMAESIDCKEARRSSRIVQPKPPSEMKTICSLRLVCELVRGEEEFELSLHVEASSCMTTTRDRSDTGTVLRATRRLNRYDSRFRVGQLEMCQQDNKISATPC